MSAQKRTGTRPEMELRRLLHKAGFRYRVDYPVPGMPRRRIDIAFPRQKLAVLVDGCFWHGCPEHSVPAKHNGAWWAQKLQSNRRRDDETTEVLRADGWEVLRVWEHEAPEDVVSEVQALVQARDAGRGRARLAPS